MKGRCRSTALKSYGPGFKLWPPCRLVVPLRAGVAQERPRHLRGSYGSDLRSSTMLAHALASTNSSRRPPDLHQLSGPHPQRLGHRPSRTSRPRPRLSPTGSPPASPACWPSPTASSAPSSAVTNTGRAELARQVRHHPRPGDPAPQPDLPGPGHPGGGSGARSRRRCSAHQRARPPRGRRRSQLGGAARGLAAAIARSGVVRVPTSSQSCSAISTSPVVRCTSHSSTSRGAPRPREVPDLRA
jgi:hypothetical protein